MGGSSSQTIPNNVIQEHNLQVGSFVIIRDHKISGVIVPIKNKPVTRTIQDDNDTTFRAEITSSFNTCVKSQFPNKTLELDGNVTKKEITVVIAPVINPLKEIEVIMNMNIVVMTKNQIQYHKRFLTPHFVYRQNILSHFSIPI